MASLEGLPNELLFHILGYLIGPFCGRVDSTGLDWPEPVPRNRIEDKPTTHPLYQLAAVSRHFNTAVEDFCRHLLLQLKDVGTFKVSNEAADSTKSRGRHPKPLPSRRNEAYRRVWMRWSLHHCAFCGKKSIRRAVFNNHLRCCQLCDRKCFPEKIVSIF